MQTAVAAVTIDASMLTISGKSTLQKDSVAKVPIPHNRQYQRRNSILLNILNSAKPLYSRAAWLGRSRSAFRGSQSARLIGRGLKSTNGV